MQGDCLADEDELGYPSDEEATAAERGAHDIELLYGATGVHPVGWSCSCGENSR